MIFLSIIFIIVFSLNQYSLINNYSYDWDIDQFMYSGSRLIAGELSWVKEFDDKSPVLQYIFAIPAFFKSVNLWITINCLLSIITFYCLFLFIKRLNYLILKNNKLTSSLVALSSSAFYLFLVSQNKPIHINSFCVNLFIISIFLLDKSLDNFSFSKIRSLLLIFIAAFLSSISISIRPYLSIAFISIGIWAPIRYIIITNKTISKRLDGLKLFALWNLILFICLIIINFLPFFITNNTSIFFTTIKLNSVGYGSESIIDTLQKQFLLLKEYKALFIFYIFFSLSILIRLFFKTKINKLKDFKKTDKLKLDIDLVFFTILCPLSTEIIIIFRHFHFHYLSLFNGYISLAAGIYLGLLMKLFRLNNLFKLFFLIIGFFTILISEEFKNPIKNKISINQKYEWNIINKFIENEKANKNDIEFLFPVSNFYHWKLSQSRLGFPRASVYKHITEGKVDKVLDEFPNLKYDYILTKKEDLCKELIKKGPELIITKYEKDNHGKFTFECLDKSDKYYLDKEQKEFKNIDWFIFRSIYKK